MENTLRNKVLDGIKNQESLIKVMDYFNRYEDSLERGGIDYNIKDYFQTKEKYERFKQEYYKNHKISLETIAGSSI